jgi:hypothetical protein
MMPAATVLIAACRGPARPASTGTERDDGDPLPAIWKRVEDAATEGRLNLRGSLDEWRVQRANVREDDACEPESPRWRKIMNENTEVAA